mgnify:CR=1 FL=1
MLTLLLAACSPVISNPEVEAIQLGETWVFAYSEEPGSSMDALSHGTAAQVDGCLQVGDAVVVWWPDQLAEVEEIVLAVEAGEAPELELGGGGMSLEEGASAEDFPAAVREHCTPTELWFSSGGEIGGEG